MLFGFHDVFTDISCVLQLYVQYGHLYGFVRCEFACDDGDVWPCLPCMCSSHSGSSSLQCVYDDDGSAVLVPAAYPQISHKKGREFVWVFI